MNSDESSIAQFVREGQLVLYLMHATPNRVFRRNRNTLFGVACILFTKGLEFCFKLTSENSLCYVLQVSYTYAHWRFATQSVYTF
jgi:hypothetical protein